MPHLVASPAPRGLRLRSIATTAAIVLLWSPAALAQTKGIQVDNSAKNARLPAPQLTITDLGDGCVRLSWTPVARARYYVLGRALGTNGLQHLEGGRDGGTEYRDRITGAATSVVYRVTAVDSVGAAGLPGTSDRVTIGGGKAESCPISRRGPTEVVASLRGNDRIFVHWRQSDGELIGQITGQRLGSDVRHFVDGRPQATTRVSDESLSGAFFPATPGEHRFEVRFVDRDGTLSDPTASNPIVIRDKGAGSDPGATPAGAAAPASPGALPAGAELSFAVSAAASLRRGGTTTASEPAGAQWSSLDPGVATVTPQGVITARAPGEARIVGISGAGAGGVRVTVMRVLVTP